MSDSDLSKKSPSDAGENYSEEGEPLADGRVLVPQQNAPEGTEDFTFNNPDVFDEYRRENNPSILVESTKKIRKVFSISHSSRSSSPPASQASSYKPLGGFKSKFKQTTIKEAIKKTVVKRGSMDGSPELSVVSLPISGEEEKAEDTTREIDYEERPDLRLYDDSTDLFAKVALAIPKKVDESATEILNDYGVRVSSSLADHVKADGYYEEICWPTVKAGLPFQVCYLCSKNIDYAHADEISLHYADESVHEGRSLSPDDLFVTTKAFSYYVRAGPYLTSRPSLQKKFSLLKIEDFVSRFVHYRVVICRNCHAPMHWGEQRKHSCRITNQDVTFNNVLVCYSLPNLNDFNPDQGEEGVMGVSAVNQRMVFKNRRKAAICLNLVVGSILFVGSY